MSKARFKLGTAMLLSTVLITSGSGVLFAQTSKEAAKSGPQAAPAARDAKTVQPPKKEAAPKSSQPAADQARTAQTPAGQVPSQQAAKPAIPGNVQLTLLIQNSLAALSQANMTGNYTVLHALAAPSFQQANPPEKLVQIFANLRNAAIDLTPVILYQPILTDTPTMDDKGLLRLRGYYDTQPQNVMFDVLFVAHQAQWRLHGIAIQTRPAATLAQKK